MKKLNALIKTWKNSLADLNAFRDKHAKTIVKLDQLMADYRDQEDSVKMVAVEIVTSKGDKLEVAGNVLAGPVKETSYSLAGLDNHQVLDLYHAGLLTVNGSKYKAALKDAKVNEVIHAKVSSVSPGTPRFYGNWILKQDI